MDSLRSAARAIADEDSALGASSAVELRLRAEVRAMARARRRRALMVAAAAALLVVAATVPLRRLIVHRPALAPAPNASAAAPNGDTVTEFFSLGFADVPVTGARIVRIEVPRSALRSFGVVPIETPGRAASAPAVADVIVGADGLARAVRFVGAKRKEVR